MVDLRTVSLEAALINGKGRWWIQQASLIIASKSRAYDWKLIYQEKGAHKYELRYWENRLVVVEYGEQRKEVGVGWNELRRIQMYMK